MAGQAARREQGHFAGLSRDSILWRKASRVVVAHGPPILIRVLPPVFGVAAALALPDARRKIAENLARIRGKVGRAREAREVARTFASYASCLAEVLSSGTKNARVPDLTVLGKGTIDEALARGKGVVMVTAHTAGWEVVGPVLGAFYGVELVMVMRAEGNAKARQLQDEARRASGLTVVHVGEDPFSSLPLMRKLRQGAVVAMQIDRAPPGMRARRVRLFGGEGEIPEGPIRLAQLSGAPLLPVFCARLGHRSYAAEASGPILVSRRADEGRIDVVAQELADAMTRFVGRHPTQWFHFDANGQK
jgi:phosphatidylinositol dimannoside acyltransferase